MQWLLAIAFVLGLTGIVLSLIGSSPPGIAIGAIVIAVCAFRWFRFRRASPTAPLKSDDEDQG